MRTYNTTFINHLVEESTKQQSSNGSMQKVYYHRHYLAQEAVGRLDYYLSRRGKNKERAVDRLIDSVVSLMGEYSKHIGYKGKTDFNPNFTQQVTDECDRLDSTRPISSYDDYVMEAVRILQKYCEILKESEKQKDRYLLVQAASLIMRQYNRETR